MHVEGLPEHVHPYSTIQFALHPSRSAVLKSSQASVETVTPSPQILVQIEGEVEEPPTQVHPVTGPEQSDLHLSTFKIFPSSHVSPVTFQLSPQIGVQTFG